MPYTSQFTTRKYGEPLNVIISARSDPYILEDSGFRAYAKCVRRPLLQYSFAFSIPSPIRSVGFAEECFGLHYGHIHDADLGDGLGRKGEHLLARQSYFPVMGTCWESVRGGQHFRAWKQNGTLANSGAWFIGCA